MLAGRPVLLGINDSQCGLMGLCGNVVVTKGQPLGGVAQALEGVTEVRRGGGRGGGREGRREREREL